MVVTGNPSEFTLALKSFEDDGILSQAFKQAQEHARQHNLVGYDRTRIRRWIDDGSRPRNRSFIVYLSSLLGSEDRLLKAYDNDKVRVKEASELRHIKTRFGSLSLAQRRDLLGDLMAVNAQRESDVRRDLSIEVKLKAENENSHRLCLNIRWVGDLSEHASVHITRNRNDLAGAFSDGRVIFRELLPDDPHASIAKMPSLRFKDSAGRKLPRQTAEPVADRSGVFSFQNDAANGTWIEFRIELLYPRSLSFYPILFGSYSILGLAEIEANLDSSLVESAGAYSFLGGAQHWVSAQVGPDSHVVEVELQEGETIMPNTGIVLYWLGSGPSS